MSVTRTLTALTLAATAALMTTALAVAPAHAGGAPDLGTVTIDHRARLTADRVSIGGTYTCTVPDAAVASGPGTIGIEVVARSDASTSGQVAVTCDGTTRSWTVTAPAGALRQGRVWVHGHLEVPDATGSTPWNLFDATVTVVGRR